MKMEKDTADAIADRVVSFVEELDAAMETGAKTLRDFLDNKKLESTFAESGVIILYGDIFSNAATEHEKFKICFAGGHKGTIRSLLREALTAIEA